MHNGISEKTAFSLDDTDSLAWSIIFSEFNGNDFDWDTMQFKGPEDGE